MYKQIFILQNKYKLLFIHFRSGFDFMAVNTHERVIGKPASTATMLNGQRVFQVDG